MKLIPTFTKILELHVAIFFTLICQASAPYAFAYPPYTFSLLLQQPDTTQSPRVRSDTATPNESPLQSSDHENNPTRAISLEEVTITVANTTISGYRHLSNEFVTGRPVFQPRNILNSPRDTTTEQERTALIQTTLNRSKWDRRVNCICISLVPIIIAGCIIYATA